MPDLPNVGEDAAAPPGSASAAGLAVKEIEALSSHHESLAEVLVRMERQRYWLRLCACVAALLVVIAAGILEWILLQHLLKTSSETEGLFVLLAISPIVSITLILIFVLIGVFRGFRESDLNAVPLETAGKMAFGNGS
ncbi:MAG: hypothetical protein OXM01_15495 [Gemmatimonadota bacterium]|nr:hypothetical protein [Gemmatimonadota bacterium]